MSFDSRKYLNSVAWRTYFRDTVLNTEATIDTPALWDTTIYPIDANENGASPIDISSDYFGVDYSGNIFSINAINVGGNQYRITLKDTFFSGNAPTESLIGIIYKSAWKGYSFAIAPVWFNFLSSIARDKVTSLEKSIIWANDPNPRLLLCENTDHPEIRPFNASYVDINNITFNPYEDYIGVPDIKLMEYDDSGNIIERTEKPYFEITGGIVTAVQFGLLDSVKDWVIKISN